MEGQLIMAPSDNLELEDHMVGDVQNAEKQPKTQGSHLQKNR
jgi:hypothetical protein